MDYKKSYTLDDIGLIARTQSSIKTRSDVDLSMNIKHTSLSIPIIGSPMDTVCNADMCIELDKFGAVGIIHRMQSIDEQLNELVNCINSKVKNVGIAVGVTGDYQERLSKLTDTFLKLNIDEITTLWICFDTANGFTDMMENAINYYNHNIKYYHTNYITMAGNINSYQGYRFMHENGMDIVRVGISAGSMCKTGDVTGIYQGTVSILDEIRFYINEYTCDERIKSDYPLICVDGGIKTSGDVTKALALGADCVMLGSLLAGFQESCGEFITDANINMCAKEFRGLASNTVNKVSMNLNNNNRLVCPEGIETEIPYKGPLKDWLPSFVLGIKSGFSYLNSNSIDELHCYIKAYPESICILSDKCISERKPHH